MIPAHGDTTEAAGGPPDEGAGWDLSARQERAVLALLGNPTIARAAEAAGVDESTMHRWLKEAAFVGAYRRARAAAFDQAIALAHRYAGSAVQVIVKIMADPGASYAARLAAAVALLKFGREGVLLDELSQRVESIEAALISEDPGRSDTQRARPRAPNAPVAALPERGGAEP